MYLNYIHRRARRVERRRGGKFKKRGKLNKTAINDNFCVSPVPHIPSYFLIHAFAGKNWYESAQGRNRASRSRKIQIHLFRLRTIIIAFLLVHFFNALQAANFHKFNASSLPMSVKGEERKFLKTVQSFRSVLWNENKKWQSSSRTAIFVSYSLGEFEISATFQFELGELPETQLKVCGN